MVADVVDCDKQIGVGVRFQDIGQGAAVQNLAGKFFGEMHGQDEDVGGRGFIANAANDFEAIHFGHGEIKHNEIGLFGLDALEGFNSVGGFPGYFDAGLVLQHGTDAMADDGMVVRNQDAVRFCVHKIEGILRQATRNWKHAAS